MRFKRVYLDNGASTKVDPKVLAAMLPYFTEKYANASAIHTFGQESSNALEKARKIIAKSINAKTSEIIFTSGGTESNNFAIKGLAFQNKRGHIITSKIEHKCILQSCKWLESQGFKITYLDVDKEGFVNTEDLKKAIKPDTFLVSIIHGNNEIGTIQNISKLGKICNENNVLFHTDACQSYTKTEIDVRKQNIDLMTLNSHKIHGPKGVGALFIRDGIKITPWQHGGGHERNLRAGTENVHGVVGFAEAVKIASNKHVEYMTKLRDKLILGALKIKGSKLNGLEKDRLCNNVNLSFSGVEGEALGGYLDAKNICSSAGSACSSKSLEPSYVLKAIGLSNEEANSSVRLTLSKFNTEGEIDYVLKVLPKVIDKLRSFSAIWKE